jgi:hypothetical protein
MLGIPARACASLRPSSSPAFFCEGPDQRMRLFWWCRLPQGNLRCESAYAPFSSCDGLPAACVHRFLGLLCRTRLGGSLVNFLQLYAAHEPDVRIELFRKHNHQRILLLVIIMQRSSSSCTDRSYSTHYSRCL